MVAPKTRWVDVMGDSVRRQTHENQLLRVVAKAAQAYVEQPSEKAMDLLLAALTAWEGR